MVALILLPASEAAAAGHPGPTSIAAETTGRYIYDVDFRVAVALGSDADASQ
jgi:hypothetical protein